MSIKFESRSVNEAFARQAVGAFASQLDPTMEELGDIKTVVSEAVTNAIVHGYADRSGFITVAVRLFEGRALEIKIKDTGCGIENVEQAWALPSWKASPTGFVCALRRGAARS